MNKYFLYLSIIAIIFTTSADAFAVNCNDKSPYFNKEGDSYYDIEDIDPLTRKQKSKIKELFSRFENKNLVGSRSFINCIGPESSAKKTTTKTELSAELNQQSDGMIVIKIESYDRNKGKTEHINLSYFGDNNPDKIIKLTNNKLVIRCKFRRSVNRSPCLNEEITEISVKNKALTIETAAYRFGQFAFHSTIKLHY